MGVTSGSLVVGLQVVFPHEIRLGRFGDDVITALDPSAPQRPHQLHNPTPAQQCLSALVSHEPKATIPMMKQGDTLGLSLARQTQ